MFLRLTLRQFTMVLALFAIMISVTGVRAMANGPELLGYESTEFVWTMFDLIQEGLTPPSSAYPLTRQEFASTFTRQEVPPAPEVANRFVLTADAYYVGFSTPYTLSQSVPTDVIYLNDRVPSMLQFGDALSVGDWMHARLLLDHTPGIGQMNGSGSLAPWKANTYGGSGEFPREGYISFGAPHASLTVGRFKSGIGYGYFGNTFLNGKAPYYDQLQATYYDDHFKFYYMIGTSHTYLTHDEEVAQTDPGWNGGGLGDPYKTFAYHRAEWHPFDWINLSYGEMNIIGGKAPDFMHINPFAIWHNTYTPRYSNVMALVDASIVPLPGVQLFGELTVDDYRLPEEGSNSNPNAFAWQVGAKYVLPFSGETKHVVGAEFTHVDPWTYNRWQPYLTMYQRQVASGLYPYSDIALGYPWGGDLNHYGAYYIAVNRDGFRVDAAYHHLDRGAIRLGLDASGQPYYAGHNDESGPTGVVERRDTVELSLTYPLPWSFTAYTFGSYSWIANFQNQPDVSEKIGVIMAGIQWRY